MAVVYAFWKPTNLTVEQGSAPTNGGASGRKPVLNDYIARLPLSARAGGRISAVGRLDKDTEGLLLLTDDGLLAERLLRPGCVSKVYEATVRLRVPLSPSSEQLERLRAGVHLADGEARVATVEVVREWLLPPPAVVRTAGAKNAKRRAKRERSSPSSTEREQPARGSSTAAACPIPEGAACSLPEGTACSIPEGGDAASPCGSQGGPSAAAPACSVPPVTAYVLRLSIAIGRNRVVRRLLAAVGLPVFELRRVRFGPLTLPLLTEGQGLPSIGSRNGRLRGAELKKAGTGAQAAVHMPQGGAAIPRGRPASIHPEQGVEEGEGTPHKEGTRASAAMHQEQGGAEGGGEGTLSLTGPGDVVRLTSRQEELLRGCCAVAVGNIG